MNGTDRIHTETLRQAISGVAIIGRLLQDDRIANDNYASASLADALEALAVLAAQRLEFLTGADDG